MPLGFEFHRSTYLPPNPQSPANGSGFIPGTEFITPVGDASGNFFNWAHGGKDLDPFDTGANTYNVLEAPVSGDDPIASNFSTYPLKPDFASVEVWIRGYFGGTGWTNITNVKLYATSVDLTDYGSGAFLNGRIATQYPLGDEDLVGGTSDFNGVQLAGPHYLQPGILQGPILSVMQQSSIGSGGFLDLTPGDGVTPGPLPYSKYAVLQLATGSGPVPGEGGRCTFTMTYDES